MSDDDHRISLNLRVDAQKHAILERMRSTGFGLAHTMRNRSDIYNEVLGDGIQMYMLKTELGDRDFERLWRIMHRMNLKKLDFEKIEKMLG